MDFILIIIFLIVGYFIGSFNTANFIAFKFYNKDLKKHGSGNLGGTNAARVLGKKIGVLVILIDALKCIFIIWLFSLLNMKIAIYGALGVILGHCFSFMINFKGGKGVASFVGMLLGLGLFILKDVTFIFYIPILVFFIVLALTKMVSLSSVALSLSASLVIALLYPKYSNLSIVHLMTIVIIVKHIPNYIRIFNKKESQVSWL